MVADDVGRLQQEGVAWESLSLADNRLYDAGVNELVRVLQQSAGLPLASLNLSEVGMTSATAAKLAELLTGEGCAARLPLTSLQLYGNDIDAEGFVALATALRRDDCGLQQIELTDHVPVDVQEAKAMDALVEGNFKDPEVILAAELQRSYRILSRVQLRGNHVTDRSATVLGDVMGDARLPVGEVSLHGNKVGATGGKALVDGLLRGGCPLVSLAFSKNPLCTSSEAIKQRDDEKKKRREALEAQVAFE